MEVKIYSPAGDKLADVTGVLALTTDGAAHAATEHVVSQVAKHAFDSPVMIVVVDDGSGVDDVFEAFSSVSADGDQLHVGTIVSKLGHGVAGTMYLI